MGRLNKDNATIESMSRADLKTLLTNVRTANESLKVALGPFCVLLPTHWTSRCLSLICQSWPSGKGAQT